ncbi:glycoside hydrolase family 43 protein [Enterococcus sp. AZ194]|uniref:glycoside hydrolase family 43 protein n=1 Tax=Enterococcus sp. AZ194 TaxID=2774629 RepID=UPI003F682EE5
MSKVSSGGKLTIQNIGDPYVLRVEETYYLYATSDFDGYYCWTSKDLLYWSEPVVCFEKNAKSFGSRLFWAPEVYEFQGKFYMYYTAQWKKFEAHCLRIGVAVAESPTGPFTDVYDSQPMFDFGYGVLDAHILKDGEENYLYYSRAWEDNPSKTADIYGVRLGKDFISVEGEAVCLIQPNQPWEKQYQTEQGVFWTEGPFVVKKDHQYHLMYSANFFASEYYGIGAAVSDSPLGPFKKYQNNPILATDEVVSGPGHNSVVDLPTGEQYCVYHAHTDYIKKGGNRQVYVTPLTFVDGRIQLQHPVS